MLKCPLLAAATLLACASLGCSTKNKSSANDAGPEGAAAMMGPGVPQPDCSADSKDWPMFGQNVCNTSSQASAGGISKDTVGKLAPKWQYDKSAGDVSATPAVAGGSVFFPDWGGMINRLDAMTGSVTWSKSISDLLTAAGKPGNLGGFVSRNTPVVTEGLVIFGIMRDPPQVITMPGTGAYLMAISQDTGAVKWVTLLEPHPVAVISGSPVVDGSTLYVGVSSQEEYSGLAAAIAPALGINYSCCSFRGSAVAVDVMTGAIKWQTYTISDELYGAKAGQLVTDAAPPPMPGYTGIAIWSSTPVVDRKRKQVYFGTGDNYSQPSGTVGKVDGNWVDAVVALDMDTGKMKWVQSVPNGNKAMSDSFAVAKMGSTGPDSDFGAGPNLYTAMIDGAPKDLVGAGQKSGYVFAFDADNGNIVWSMNIGPGGGTGGIQWGTATDGTRIYTGNNNSSGAMLTLLGTGANAGQPYTTGSWTALNAATGDIIWQIANPALDKPMNAATVNGPVAVVNGVMFGGSMDAQGTMFALDGATGDVLWQFQCGATVYGGPAISGGMVYWGCGYPGQGGLTAKRPLGFGTSTTKASLYAFSVP
jgi:polyvinyl alcohol dehydrogenase (cytochrome)